MSVPRAVGLTRVLLLPVLADRNRCFRQPLDILPQFRQRDRREVFVPIRHWPPQRFQQTRFHQQRNVIRFEAEKVRRLLAIQARGQRRQVQEIFPCIVHTQV